MSSESIVDSSSSSESESEPCPKRTKNVHDSMERIRSLIECTVCHNVPVSPIQECKNGHIVCGLCSEKYKMCSCFTISNEESSSEVEVVPILTPSYSIERIVNECQLTVPCKYKNNGCSKEVKPNEFRNHIVECPYRPFSCFNGTAKIYGNCEGLLFNINSFLSHLEDVHKIRTLDENKNDECTRKYPYRNLGNGIEKGIDTHTLSRCDGKIFLRHTICQTNSNIYFWVSIIGDETVAAKYKYEWTIINPKGNPNSSQGAAKYVWKLPVVPAHKHGLDDALQLGCVAVMDFDMFIRCYCSDEMVDSASKKKFRREWKQKVKIHKI